jgi:hypothetical protein
MRVVAFPRFRLLTRLVGRSSVGILAIAAMLSSPSYALDESIQAVPLGQASVGELGALSPQEGGFGSQWWQNSTPEQIEAAFAMLPANPGDWSQRQLQRRLLLSPVSLPDEQAGYRLLQSRTDRLESLGYPADALRLLQSWPRDRQSSEWLWLARSTARLLNGDDGGCQEPTPLNAEVPGGEAGFLSAYCLWVKGEQSAAEVALNVLGDRQSVAQTAQPKDKADAKAQAKAKEAEANRLSLYQTVVTGQPLSPKVAVTLKGLDAALLQHAIFSDVKGVVAGNWSVLAKLQLLRNKTLPPDVKLMYAENLVESGVLGVAEWQQLATKALEGESVPPASDPATAAVLGRLSRVKEVLAASTNAYNDGALTRAAVDLLRQSGGHWYPVYLLLQPKLDNMLALAETGEIAPWLVAYGIRHNQPTAPWLSYLPNDHLNALTLRALEGWKRPQPVNATVPAGFNTIKIDNEPLAVKLLTASFALNPEQSAPSWQAQLLSALAITQPKAKAEAVSTTTWLSLQAAVAQKRNGEALANALAMVADSSPNALPIWHSALSGLAKLGQHELTAQLAEAWLMDGLFDGAPSK